MHKQHSDSTPVGIDSYRALGRLYDEFMATDRYDIVAALFDGLIRHAGAPGRRLLDVGCGTGKAAISMQELGYSATGVDLSPAMLEHARRKASGTGIDFVQADMRDLPQLGQFDVAIAVGDVLNHLLDESDLVATLSGVRRQLRPGGLLVFDVNTLYNYRNWYASTFVAADNPGKFIVWQGHATELHPSGAEATATLSIFSELNDGSWERVVANFQERHYPQDRMADCLAKSGFVLEEVIGISKRGEPLGPLIDDDHNKGIWVARSQP